MIGAFSLAAFWGGTALAYSMLPLASGMNISPSIVDIISAPVFWVLLGLGLSPVARWLRERHRLTERCLWALAATAWVASEAMFMVSVVVKPTRWPPLAFSLVAIILPAIIAAGVSLAALRSSWRGGSAFGRRPALVIVASWAGLAAWTLWIPRWLQAVLSAPDVIWFAWGALDGVWLLGGIASVVLFAAVPLANGRWRWGALACGALLAGLQLLPSVRISATFDARNSSAPNIVWIIVDAVRADHVGGYGYERSTMPNFDELAHRGTLVRGHVSAGARTENTYAKMLPIRESLDGYEAARPTPLSSIRSILPESWIPGQPGLVASLRLTGYETAIFHTYYDLLEDRGLQPWLQSFEHRFTTRMSGDASLGAYVTRIILGDRLDGIPRMDRWAAFRRRYLAEQVSTEAVRFLESRDDSRPLFLVVHLAGGHFPYYAFNGAPRVSSEPAISTEASRYDDALRSADQQVRQIVDAVDARLRNATTFVFADHGAKFQGATGLPHFINVPLLVLPALAAEPRTVTSSQDIAATTLRLSRNAPPVCDSRMARDLRCTTPLESTRVVDHSGRGRFILATLLEGQLVTIDLSRVEPVAYTTGARTIEPCRVLRKLRIAFESILPSPLERRENWGERLARVVQQCVMQAKNRPPDPDRPVSP